MLFSLPGKPALCGFGFCDLTFKLFEKPFQVLFIDRLLVTSFYLRSSFE